MKSMFKIKNLLTIVPFVFSVNLLSINNSYTSGLSEGAKSGKENEDAIDALAGRAVSYAESKGIDVATFRNPQGPTMGSRYNGGSLKEVCEFVNNQYSALVKKVKNKSLSEQDLAVISLLIDRISTGGKFSFDNVAEDMVEAIEIYSTKGMRAENELSKDAFENYIEGVNYLATAVLQEMLIKLCTTGSALLNRWEYEECIEKIIEYLRQKTKHELKFINANKEEVSANVLVGNMVDLPIFHIMGEFYGKTHQVSLNIKSFEGCDFTKRLEIKNYFRNCTIKGIENYDSENSNVLKKTKNADTKTSLLNKIDDWKNAEIKLYNCITELQNSLIETHGLLEKITKTDEKVEEFRVNNNKSVSEMTETGVELSRESIDGLAKFIDSRKILVPSTVNTHRRLGKIGDEIYEYVSGKSDQPKSVSSQAIIEQHYGFSFASENVKDFDAWDKIHLYCRRNAVRKYLERKSIVDEILGSKIEKYNTHESIRVLSWNLKAGTILNKFTYATKNDIDYLVSSESFKCDKPGILNDSLQASVSLINKYRNVNGKFDWIGTEEMSQWGYEQAKAVTNTDDDTLTKLCKKNIGFANTLSKIPDKELKKFEEININNLPIYLYRPIFGNSWCYENRSIGGAMVDGETYDDRDFYINPIWEMREQILCALKKIKSPKEKQYKQLYCGLYGELLSLYAWSMWQKNNGTWFDHFQRNEREISPELSFAGFYDGDEQNATLYKKMMQWSVLYNALLLKKKFNNDKDLGWIDNEREVLGIRGSLLPLIYAINGADDLNFNKLYSEYIKCLKIENLNVYFPLKNEYIVLDSYIMNDLVDISNEKVYEIKEGATYCELKLGNGVDQLAVLRINKLQTDGTSPVLLYSKDGNKKILAYHKKQTKPKIKL